MLAIPDTLAPDPVGGFLASHWQKHPLWMPAAIPANSLPDIDPDELAWLATLDDVESRLVFTESRDGRPRYRMESGPFDETVLASLPPTNWTLLVQDVEKHLPALRSCFEWVSFIPDWRIDDLMISVAAPGGSVGPHSDNYDVFLVQSSGQRNWSWTEREVQHDPEASQQLRLLTPFDADAAEVARPGDVLYLNPGVAHHGVAVDLCVTCSIGMRAPQVSELAGRTVEERDEFYEDRDLEANEARPGYIAPPAIARVESLLARHGFADVDAELALGRFATAPKDWLEPDPDRDRALVEMPLAVHGMARLCWSDDSVFANGRQAELLPEARESVAALCRSRTLDAAGFELWQHAPWGHDLLEFLWDAGIFDPDAAQDA